MAIIETINKYRFCDLIAEEFELSSREPIFDHLWELSEEMEGGKLEFDIQEVKDMYREWSAEDLAERVSFDSYERSFAQNIGDSLSELKTWTDYEYVNGAFVEKSTEDMRFTFFDSISWKQDIEVENEYNLPLDKLRTLMDYIVLSWQAYTKDWEQNDEIGGGSGDSDLPPAARKLLDMSQEEILKALDDEDDNEVKRLANGEYIWDYLESFEDNVTDVIEAMISFQKADEFARNSYAPGYEKWLQELEEYAERRISLVTKPTDNPNCIVVYGEK